MKNFFPLIFIGLSLWFSTPVRAVDSLSRFLEAQSFQVITDDSGESITVDPLGESFAFERYAVKDEYGNRFVLNLASPFRVLEHVAVHQFLEALGVAHIPAYPTFVRRGMHGIPLADEARRLGRQDHGEAAGEYYGVWGKDNEWIPAFIQPEWVDLNPMPAPAEGLPPLTLSQLEELAEVYIALHALRVDGFQLKFINGHPFVLYASRPFENSEPKTYQSLEKNFWDRTKGMKYYPVDQLWELEDAQVAHFIRHTGEFIGRVEKLRSGNLHLKIFESFFHEFENRWRSRATGPQIKTRLALKNLFNGTVDALRGDFTKYLRERVGRRFRILPSSTQGVTLADVPVATPHLGFPDSSLEAQRALPDIAESQTTKGKAKDILLSLALARFDAREEAIAHWKTIDFDPIGILLNRARKESRLHPIYTQPFPGPVRFENIEPPQFFVNFHAPKTLLVVSPNDAEGRVIEQIALRLGPYLGLEVYRGSHTQGDMLSETDIYDIRFHAMGGNFERIVLCEFGDTTKAALEALRYPGLSDILHLDHHQDRLNRYSTAEQFFRLYNYHPSLAELLVAVRDRSGPTGFRDFGYTVEQAARFFGSRDLEPILRNYRPFFQERRQIYEVEHEGNLESLATPFGLLTYPEIPNVLMVGRGRLRFLGVAPVARALHGQFHSMGGVWRNQQYIGGDPSGVMFWGVRVDRNGRREKALQVARETISQSPVLRDHCWQVIASQGGTPFPPLD